MKREMVILDQNAIEKAGPMVHTSAAQNRVFIEDSQTRHGLTRIDDTGASPVDAVYILTRKSRNAGHALQKVESGSLGREQGARRAADFSHQRSRMRCSAISDRCRELS